MAKSIDRLVHELAKLPGVGEKTALRYALAIMRKEPQYARELADSILQAREGMQLCSECFAFTERDPCSLCADTRRDQRLICVVEEPADLLAVERTGVFRGQYHVLHGALSPLEGIGPDQLKITELLRRLEKNAVAELVIATNMNVEGEATALYLMRLFRPLGIKVTRLSSGIPVGGDLEYVDTTTLSRAFEERYPLE